MKHLPSALTFIRLLAAPLLLAMEPLSRSFIVLYLVCGLSDMLDGYLARRTGTESRWGARLDSIADFVFIAVMAVVLLPLIGLKPYVWLWIGGILLLRMLSMTVALVKFRSFAMLHTYANKITGFLLFLVPLFLSVMSSSVPAVVLCAVATASALEELVIMVTSRELDFNCKGLLFARPKR